MKKELKEKIKKIRANGQRLTKTFKKLKRKHEDLKENHLSNQQNLMLKINPFFYSNNRAANRFSSVPQQLIVT